MITLQLAATPKAPVAAAPSEIVEPIEPGQHEKWGSRRRNRWKALRVLVFASLLPAAGAAFILHKRSQSSFVRAAETSPVPNIGDQELQSERRSAEAGDPAAQRALAMRYFEGNGMPEDRMMAMHWLRQAANSRDIEAQYLLGVNLAAENKPEAYKWLVISHLAGSEKSFAELQRLTPELTPTEIGKVRYELGLAYANGEGTQVDYVRAYIWMTLAATAGISESKQKLAEFSQRMSREQIASAARQSSAWLARMRAPQNQDQAAHD
jgi:TPR repeat protein